MLNNQLLPSMIFRKKGHVTSDGGNGQQEMGMLAETNEEGNKRINQ